MRAKLKRYVDRKRGGDIGIPVLHLEAEDKGDKEILNKIFASEKLVPVAIGDHPDHLQDMIMINDKPEAVMVKRVSLVLE